MTTYNTGNPIGSTEAKDLYDNAENLDIAINSPSANVWTDRLGQARKTWRGIQSEAQLEIAQVVGEVTAQSQQYLDASIVARDEARAAASATGPIKFYGTKAQADAAIGTLANGDIIEISQDETRAGARTRYKVQAGALVFVVNLDQLRLDLSTENGALMVGNAVDKRDLANGAAPTMGASMVGFQQEGTGAVPRTAQDKMMEHISVKDFGAVGDGVTDDYLALKAALSAAYAMGVKEVLLDSKNYLISASLSVPEGMTLHGKGNRSSFSLGGEGMPTRITKKSSMTTTGVVLSGKRSRLENIGVYAEVGATGDGIWIAANYVGLANVASNGHAGIGIRVGATVATYLNCNGFTLRDITVASNGSYGVYISDDYTLATSGTVGDTNAGLITGLDARSNGAHGIYTHNSMRNTYLGVLAEVNTGYGAYFTNKAIQHSWVGGDVDELNTAGSLYNAGEYNVFIGLGNSGYTEAGSYTQFLSWTTATLNQTTIKSLLILVGGQIAFPSAQVPSADPNTLDDYEEGSFTPTIGGSTTSGTGTYTAQVGRYTKIGRKVFFNIALTWTNLTGAAGALVINGLPFASANVAANTVPVTTIADGVALTAGHTMQNFVFPNSSQVAVRQLPSGGGGATTVGLAMAGTIYISGNYDV